MNKLDEIFNKLEPFTNKICGDIDLSIDYTQAEVSRTYYVNDSNDDYAYYFAEQQAEQALENDVKVLKNLGFSDLNINYVEQTEGGDFKYSILIN